MWDFSSFFSKFSCDAYCIPGVRYAHILERKLVFITLNNNVSLCSAFFLCNVNHWRFQHCNANVLVIRNTFLSWKSLLLVDVVCFRVRCSVSMKRCQQREILCLWTMISLWFCLWYKVTDFCGVMSGVKVFYIKSPSLLILLN